MSARPSAMVVSSFVVQLLAATAPAAAGREQDLLAAVRKGDLEAVRALLDAGVPVDAKFRYDRTALSFAADRGQAEITRLLLERGADVNAKDTFYGATPLVWASGNQHVEVVRILLARGASGVGGVLGRGVEKQNAELVDVALGTAKLTPDELSDALEAADKKGATAIAARLRTAGAVLPSKADFKVDPELLARYAGSYQEAAGTRQALMLSVADGVLQASLGGPPLKLGAYDALSFRPLDLPASTKLVFKTEGDRILGVTLKNATTERWFARVEGPRP